MEQNYKILRFVEYKDPLKIERGASEKKYGHRLSEGHEQSLTKLGSRQTFVDSKYQEKMAEIEQSEYSSISQGSS